MADARRVREIYNRQADSYAQTAARQRAAEQLRARVFPRARGDVLELGVGTGVTFPHYPRNLRRLVGVDASEAMLAHARARAVELAFPVELLTLDFQTLPFAPGSFDAVTSSLALCGVPVPSLLFAEIRRVLRPGGQLLSVEHIRPPNPILGASADLVNPLYHHFVGCHLNRRTLDLLRDSSFRVEVLESRMAGIMVALSATPA